jgi:tRNA dimethylallyltransferase
MGKSRIVLIAGPTASGKSALATDIAAETGGIVVNADSMQVFRELEVLTARPSPRDQALAEHALYGHVSGTEPYSVGRWLRDVQAVLDRASRDQRTVVIVGGTGLYFKALTDGLAPVPPIRPDIRDQWRSAAKRREPAALHGELSARDPETAARLRPTDPQRLVRALEVLDSTGKGLAYWQSQAARGLLDADRSEKLLVVGERAEIQARAERRFDRMMADAALAEVERLMSLGLPDDAPILGALGVRPLMAHLRGDLSRDDAVGAAKAETRRYIKRQLTWTKRHMITWNHTIMK